MISDNNLLYELIRSLEKKLVIQNDNELKCCGVSFAQYRALIEIGRLNCISLNELAESLNLDESTMSRTVNILVNEHLAERYINKKDRRYVCIELTDRGKSLYNEIEISRAIYFKRVLQKIPEEKREQLLESLEILLTLI